MKKASMKFDNRIGGKAHLKEEPICKNLEIEIP